MDYRDIVIEDLASDLARMEDVACGAFVEAVAWRHVVLVALSGYAEQWQRAERLERRLRQVMGIDAWHPEQAA